MCIIYSANWEGRDERKTKIYVDERFFNFIFCDFFVWFFSVGSSGSSGWDQICRCGQFFEFSHLTSTTTTKTTFDASRITMQHFCALTKFPCLIVNQILWNFPCCPTIIFFPTDNSVWRFSDHWITRNETRTFFIPRISHWTKKTIDWNQNKSIWFY